MTDLQQRSPRVLDQDFVPMPDPCSRLVDPPPTPQAGFVPLKTFSMADFMLPRVRFWTLCP